MYCISVKWQNWEGNYECLFQIKKQQHSDKKIYNPKLLICIFNLWNNYSFKKGVIFSFVQRSKENVSFVFVSFV